MKPIVLLALLWGSLWGSALAQDESDPVVLSLGDTEITRSDFDQRFEFYVANLAAQQGMPLTEETRPLFDQLRPSYLEQLGTEQLVLALGRARGLGASEGYADEQIAAIRANFDSDEAYREGLASAGLGSEERLRLYLEEAELSRQTVAALREQVEVPDYLLTLAYDASRPALTRPEQTCARHILVETQAEAEAIRAELEAGGSFEALASERSLDPGSAAQGGDLGCFGRGSMVPEFETAAFATEVGTVSRPVASPYGYHLVLPYDRQEGGIVPLEEVRERLLEQLELQIVRKVIEGYRANSALELFPDALGNAQTDEE